MGLVVSYPFEPSRNDTNHRLATRRAHRAAVVPSGAGVQKAPITGLTLSILARTALVTSVGESCLVRIFSASGRAWWWPLSPLGSGATPKQPCATDRNNSRL